jgi:putative transposase
MKHSETQIVEILAEAAGGEAPVVRICRKHGISEQTFYRWRRAYGGLGAAEVKRLRELEAENARLRRMLVDRDLELEAMRSTPPIA